MTSILNNLEQDRPPRMWPGGQSDGIGRAVLICLLTSTALILVNCDLIVPRNSWSRKWGPMVPHETFPGDCSICHTTDNWKDLATDFEFDHEKETGFDLVGAHSRAACLRCHNDRGPVETYIARGCGGCHADPHKSTLGIDCTECHNEDVWMPIGLIADHSRTLLPLIGVHAITPCESCHLRATTGDFKGAPATCHLCHQREAARAFPNHAINGWVRDCERCHTPSNWTTPGFDHSGYPLDGAHAVLECTDCHVGGQMVGTPNDCFSCHRNDYLTAPNHVADAFSTNCEECHNTSAFR